MLQQRRKLSKGFDIVIGNPPYLSNKDTTELEKDIYTAIYGKSDDLYHYFFQRSFEVDVEGGLIGLITSDTYMTIGTKRDLRELLQAKRLRELRLLGSTAFRGVGISTNIAIVRNLLEDDDYELLVADKLTTDEYTVKVSVFRDAANNIFFLPNSLNMQMYDRYNDAFKKLKEKWWDKIDTSKKIAANDDALSEYRRGLKPGDLTLMGLVTDGGVGLQTGDNGRFVGVADGHKIADRIREPRPNKFWKFVEKMNRQGKKIDRLPRLNSKAAVTDFLSGKTEGEMRILFNELKEECGRSIFGSGYIFNIVNVAEVADITSLSDDEERNGIDPSKPHFVPYDKGDRDGNRWFAETPYYIAWSKENVAFLKNSAKARWQGYTFYFKNGFCWTNVLNPNARLIKCRLKGISVHDVGSMSLFSCSDSLPTYYLISLLNSNLIFDFYKNFINQSVNIQMNDIRQIPIVVPTKERLKRFEDFFTRAVAIKERHLAGTVTKTEAADILQKIQIELDEEVYDLYGIEPQIKNN